MLTILFVDDNQLNLQLYEQLAKKLEGADALCFASPGEALEWCRRSDPDLAVVDYMMPEIDGLEFIRRFRSLEGKKAIPILMVTAVAAKDVRYSALAAGANDFLNKPIDGIEFIARARNMLALRDYEKDLSSRAVWLTEQVRKATAEIVARERETVYRLSRAAEFHDATTGTHIVRIGYICRSIARAANLRSGMPDVLFAAAPMHDIGKVAIPDSILMKPGPLTAAEEAVMRLHTVIGHQILKDSDSTLLQAAAEIALTHHERFDGTGYPNGTSARDIPLAGRVCAISDVFDALTSERPYKKAWTAADAVAEIDRLSGTYFDPQLVEAFHTALPDILDVKARLADDGARGAPLLDFTA